MKPSSWSLPLASYDSARAIKWLTSPTAAGKMRLDAIHGLLLGRPTSVHANNDRSTVQAQRPKAPDMTHLGVKEKTAKREEVVRGGKPATYLPSLQTQSYSSQLVAYPGEPLGHWSINFDWHPMSPVFHSVPQSGSLDFTERRSLVGVLSQLPSTKQLSTAC